MHNKNYNFINFTSNFGIIWTFLFNLVYQEYVPEYDEITSKLVWEEERLAYVPESGVARSYVI